jgi:hypothetical protein
MSRDEDEIIAHFSDADLLYWHEQFRTERLSQRQIDRIDRLQREAAAQQSDLAPPNRRLSRDEWFAVHRIDRPTAERDEKKAAG